MISVSSVRQLKSTRRRLSSSKNRIDLVYVGEVPRQAGAFRLVEGVSCGLQLTGFRRQKYYSTVSL